MKFSLFINCLLTFVVFQKADAQVPKYVPTNGLVAWYSFNNNVDDLSGNGNSPLNYGANFVNDRFENPNAALEFNGFNSYMTLNIPSFRVYETGEFSYSFWLNKQSQTSSGVVLMNGTNNGGYFSSIVQGQNETQFGVSQQQSKWVWAGCAQTINTWDHYVATYNAGFMSIYKNGIICTTAIYTISGALSANLPLYFGRGLPGALNYYNGLMDDVGIWTRELTPQEIAGLYNYAVGMEELSNKSGLSVFSNSAEGFINVKLNSSATGIEYVILDNADKVVMSGNLTEEETRISISNLTPGTYLLKTNDGGQQSFSILETLH